ncbi:hypothetical protein [Sphingomonas sp.]|jgi:hypothetical protein|uniref:hypothetical protein n=1 Tax=Sphingomonas sp. TaxID=28214 RepID=UPI0035616E72
MAIHHVTLKDNTEFLVNSSKQASTFKYVGSRNIKSIRICNATEAAVLLTRKHNPLTLEDVVETATTEE